MHPANITYNHLSIQERTIAIQRLTALWAFVECGLGGVLHALQIPFTGLLVGGLAIVIITFLAHFSQRNYSIILKSLLIVLIVKAMVSPHTPFPAYVAVSFQACMAFLLYRFFGVNFFSILFLSVIAMLESAVQKLVILTIFFGKSLWTSINIFVEFITQQMNVPVSNGSWWIMGIYLLIYLAGGICIALLTFKTLKKFAGDSNYLSLNSSDNFHKEYLIKSHTTKKKGRLFLLITVLVILSIILFVLSPDKNEGWIKVLQTISWTVTAIMIWYLLNPLITKCIRLALRKNQSRHKEDILRILSFLPVARYLTMKAWKKSSLHSGWQRWQYFIATLVYWSLTYAEPVPNKTSDQ